MSTSEEVAASLVHEPQPVGRFDGLRRRARRVWMAIREDERGPADYDEDEDERRLLLRIIKEQTRRPRGYQESGPSLLKWILGVLALLVVSTIGGSIAVYGQFTALRAEVTEWKSAQQREIDAQGQRLDRLESRR